MIRSSPADPFRPSFGLRAGALLLGSLGLFARVAAGQIDVSEERDFSNSAYVPLSERGKAELFAGRRALESGDVTGVIDAAQRLLEIQPPGLVEWSDRLLVATDRAGRILLAALPTEGRRLYRERFARRAEGMWRAARSRRDVRALLAAARRHPLSEAATRACRDALRLAAERGDAAAGWAAFELLDELGTAGPDDLAAAAGLARLAGWTGRARRLAGRLAAAKDAVVRLAGEERSAAAYGSALLRAVSPQSSPLERGALTLVPLGVLPAEERFLFEPPIPDPLGDRALRFPPHAVTRCNGVFYALGLNGVYRLEPRFSEAASVFRYADFGVDSESREVVTRDLSPAEAGPVRAFVLADRERSFFGTGEERSRLVAWHVDRPSRAAWVVDTGSPDAPEELRGFVLEGPPVGFEDRIVALGSRLDEDTTVALFVFGAEDGRLLRRVVLARGARVPRYEARNRRSESLRARPAPPLLLGGTAICVTHVGVVAAVDLERGVVDWVFRYNRIRPVDPDTYSESAFYDTGGWVPRSPVAFEDGVVVTPSDSRFLYQLATRPSPEGHIVLGEPVYKGPRDYFVGVDEERRALVFLMRDVIGPTRTRYRLSATGYDGEWLWEGVALPAEDDVVGRPLIVGDVVFLPTTKGLYRFRLDQEGRAFDGLAPLVGLGRNAGATYGNLRRVGDALFSISPLLVARIEARRDSEGG